MIGPGINLTGDPADYELKGSIAVILPSPLYSKEFMSQSSNKRLVVQINERIKSLGDDAGKISDGYHTFDELYDHRITLFIALCHWVHQFEEEYSRPVSIWRSKKHSDGTSWAGWFIAGIGKEKGEMITYHIPIYRWHELAGIETLDQAPEYDGHTSVDVLKRIKEYLY